MCILHTSQRKEKQRKGKELKISLCSFYWGGREIVFQSMEFLYVPKKKKKAESIYSIEHNIKEVLVFCILHDWHDFTSSLRIEKKKKLNGS